MSDLLTRAREIVVGHQRGSISLVQRHLKIRYIEAAALLEDLEREGVVGPIQNNGGRNVLVLPTLNVDRGLNRQARNPASPASNGPKVENGLGTPQGVGPFQEGAPRSRGTHRQVGTPDQHPSVAKAMAAEYQAWIDFYHRGEGDYADFLRKRLPSDSACGVMVVQGSSEPRPPCAVCGTPYAEHGSFPTCASHPYTPDGNCQHVIGAACVGAECKGGCVHARGAPGPQDPRKESRRS